MNNNHPPFRVGQKVVCVDDDWTCECGPVKNEVCRIREILPFLNRWYLDLEGYGEDVFHINCFAPIDYDDITKELAEKGTTEETPDVIKIKEFAN